MTKNDKEVQTDSKHGHDLGQQLKDKEKELAELKKTITRLKGELKEARSKHHDLATDKNKHLSCQPLPVAEIGR